MGVNTLVLPNNPSGQSGTAYKANLDAVAAVMSRLAAAFSPYADLQETFFPAAVDVGGDKIAIASHNFLDDHKVQLTTTGTVLGGLALVTDYFVVNRTAADFKLSATKAGAVIDLTSAGTGIHTLTVVTDMTVSIAPGVIPVIAGIPTEVAPQMTALITAPTTNPRKDIVRINALTGTVGVVTGTEAASPVDPAVPAGNIAICRINLTTGMTEITNVDLDDLRYLTLVGLATALAGNGLAALSGKMVVDLHATPGLEFSGGKIRVKAGTNMTLSVGGVNAPAIITQAAAEAGTATIARFFSAERVKQAIDAFAVKGATTLIGTAVAANSATLGVAGLTSAHDTYLVFFQDLIPINDDVDGRFRIGDSGGIDSGASDYGYWHGWENSAQATNQTPLNSLASSYVKIMGSLSGGDAVGTAAGEGCGGVLKLHMPGDGSVYPQWTYKTSWMDANPTPRIRGAEGFGARLALITTTQVQFHFEVGNIDTGRLTVLGVNHA